MSKYLKIFLSLLEMKNLQVVSNGTVKEMCTVPGTLQVLKITFGQIDEQCMGPITIFFRFLIR